MFYFLFVLKWETFKRNVRTIRNLPDQTQIPISQLITSDIQLFSIYSQSRGRNKQVLSFQCLNYSSQLPSDEMKHTLKLPFFLCSVSEEPHNWFNKYPRSLNDLAQNIPSVSLNPLYVFTWVMTHITYLEITSMLFCIAWYKCGVCLLFFFFFCRQKNHFTGQEKSLILL